MNMKKTCLTENAIRQIACRIASRFPFTRFGNSGYSAEDIGQDVLIKLHIWNNPKFESKTRGEQQAHVRTVALNRCRDVARKYKIPLEPLYEAGSVGNNETFSKSYADWEAIELFKNRLPKNLKSILEEIIACDWDDFRAANHLRVSRKTVQNRWAEILKYANTSPCFNSDGPPGGIVNKPQRRMDCTSASSS